MKPTSKCRICNICGQELNILPVQSPMVTDDLWNTLLNLYGLSENRAGNKLPALTPVYICTGCMEKALNRKLTLTDIQELPFNLYFRLFYFYKVPIHTIIRIRKYLETCISDSSNQLIKLQREVDFMNGVLMPFIAPECAIHIPSNQSLAQQLSQFSDNDLLLELKRRKNER